MEKYRALVVCGTGMGSSMLLKIMVERVINRNELPIILEADVLAGADSFDGEFIIAMADLLPHLEKTNKPLVGVKNMVDKEEILDSLNKVLKQLSKG